MNNNRKDIIRVIAISTIISALSFYKGVKIYDDNFNHLSEYCPLNDILGIEHQINKVNEEFGNNGVRAIEVKNNQIYVLKDKKIDFNNILKHKNNSSLIYDYARRFDVKTIPIRDDDTKIVITSGERITDKGVTKIKNPKIISYIKKLEKTR